MPNYPNSRHPNDKPLGPAAGYISLAVGVIPALGTLLLVFGVSPGFVAAHPGDSGFDRFSNHLCYFGPFVVISWFFFWLTASKKRFVLWNILLSIVWVLGLCVIA